MVHRRVGDSGGGDPADRCIAGAGRRDAADQDTLDHQDAAFPNRNGGATIDAHNRCIAIADGTRVSVAITERATVYVGHSNGFTYLHVHTHADGCPDGLIDSIGTVEDAYQRRAALAADPDAE